MKSPSPVSVGNTSNPIFINKERSSLLTLSQADLKGETGVNDADNDQLVLLQLPSSDLSLSDMSSSSARIIAKPNNGQARLLVESTGKTFDISRVETSNVLVLVPPPQEHNSMKTSPPPLKRSKTDTSPVPTRLLQPGGSGASFLEVKECVLHLNDLAEQLKDHVFDPYNGGALTPWRGRTISDLALELQCSEQEVKNGLQTIQAFGMPRETNNKFSAVGYGLLAEEAIQESKTAIVAALAECDEVIDYAGKGISVESFIQEVTKRMESDEMYPQVGHVVRHCLRTLRTDQDAEEADSIRLDRNKIALCVAHRVFRTQSSPWEESAFLSRWHRDLPGVDMSPSMDLLCGVAIRIRNQSGQLVWKYFPEDKLPSQPEERFQILFAERERWTMDEIEPYLKRLVEDSLSTTSSLLLRYAWVISEDVGGVPTKKYVKR